MTATSELLDAALGYAARGWPVLPCARKVPRARHGVHDASVDPDVIRGWWTTWPLADVAIATGAPGPIVVDVDDPRAVPDLVATLDALGGPCAATARGLHFHCAGTSAGTVAIEGGEVRGRGSYVLVPPSIHPSGKAYVWLVEPGAPLPTLPDTIAGKASTAGAGAQEEVDHVPPGGMYTYLVDSAVRCARAGMPEAVIAKVLIVLFDTVRVPGAGYGDPAAGARDTRRIAAWAARSDIAERERADVVDFAQWARARGATR